MCLFRWRGNRHKKLPLMYNKLMGISSLNVFLCHCSHDKHNVRQLYRRLQQEEGITAWFDEENLLPGQEWDLEIKIALRRADVILVCMSHASITKEGYIQKEIRIALDFADEKPESTIYIVPLRLEDCEVPERLGKYQWCDYFGDDERKARGYVKLIKSFQMRREAIKIANTITIKPDPVSVVTSADEVNMTVLPSRTERKPSVLWVEDSARLELRNLVGPIYGGGNYDFQLAEDITSATTYVRQKKYDVLILDVRLPPGVDTYWRKFYQFDLSSEGGGLGLRFLHWLMGHDPFCPYAPPDGFDGVGIAIFSIESPDTVKAILKKMKLGNKVIYKQKVAGLPDTVLLELIKEAISLT